MAAPDWFASPALQCLVTRDGRTLAAAEVAELLEWFQAAIPGGDLQMLDGLPLPVWRREVLPPEIRLRVTQLRGRMEPAALDCWTVALTRVWLEQLGIQTARKTAWLLPTIGLLGGGGAAALLGAHLRGENHALRCKGEVGIAALIEIGSRGALLELAQVATKCRTRERGAMARCALQRLATRQGLTPDQLQDRILPDCGFDSRGQRVLSYGRKTFAVKLNEALAPYLQADDGKRLTSLPKPTAKDDATVCAQAKADWKTMRTQIQQTTRWLSRRFELAMILGETWAPADFMGNFGKHPLARHIVQRLLWVTSNGEAGPPDLFRIAEDNSLADVADRTFELSPSCHGIRPVHPLDIDWETRAAWQEVFADYGIVTPFSQLDRPVFLVPPSQRSVTIVDRFPHPKVEVPALIFPLETRGWDRTTPHHDGVLEEHTRTFESAGVTACVSYEPGAFLGDLLGSPTQSIKSLIFRPHPGPAPDPLPLGAVPARVYSETMRDLATLVPAS
ncbi:MAG TPA: DUF4132 domain-containing protein [Lacunisphaera sp.]|nr:DUF4132 domain-containing protein [Lacunisphaera sp.]